MLAALDARMDMLRQQLLHAARHLAGAKALADRLYGVGPLAGLAMTCWLGGAGRFSSSRNYAAVKDRTDGKIAALSQARKIVRQA